MRILEIHSKTQMQAWVAPVWQLLGNAYANVEGGLHYTSPCALIKDTDSWSISILDGRVTAVTIFKQRRGRKLVAFAKAKGRCSRKALIDLLTRALQTGWMEVSGAAEKFIMQECQGRLFVLSASLAHQLLQKVIEPAKDDAYHYYRNIMGQKKLKVALGTPSDMALERNHLLAA